MKPKVDTEQTEDGSEDTQRKRAGTRVGDEAAVVSSIVHFVLVQSCCQQTVCIRLKTVQTFIFLRVKQ